ncbi:MAG: TIGR00159 family protein [Chlorobiales bacterium]|jgi:diadenylate cyclase|nr:TIGR00159 family protein [Chlorobiales bacterium]
MELLRIGFLSFTLLDLADVSIVTFMLYKLYWYMKGTLAAQIFLGLLVLLAGSAGASFLNLTSLDWIFSRLTSIWFIVVVILFQPEIRRLLLFVGQNPMFGHFFRSQSDEVINAVVGAVAELSDLHYGALIVFVRNAGLRLYIETGEPLKSTVSKRLLISLFFPNTPLHDGAVIIRNNVIEAARCVLPLTQNESISESFGMRHRAALGISEVSDAFIVVVSEETGRISVAENGQLFSGLTIPELRARLKQAVSEKPIAPVQQD